MQSTVFISFACLYFYITSRFVNCIEFSLGNGKALKFVRFFSECENKGEFPLVFEILNTTNKGSEVFIDMDATVKKDPPTLLFSINVMRCNSVEQPDTCIKMPTMKTRNYCDVVNDKFSFFGSMLNCWKPVPRCPFKKNKYQGRGCSLSMEKFNWFPLGNYYWNTEVILTNERTKRVFTCYRFSANVVRTNKS